MAFFRKEANGSVCFAPGTKHAGKTVEEVSREDPKYLRWARREMALWAPDDVAQAIDKAMITNNVPFSIPRRKKG
jgi:hypothetical protein